MPTWNLGEGGVREQLMHKGLTVGAIMQTPGTRNMGHAVRTEILQLHSFLPVFLLTMWILHTKLRYGQASSLCLPSLPLHPMHSTGQPLGCWTFSIWRRFQSQITPSWTSALISLVYHKKWHKHSHLETFRRKEFSPPGQLYGKAWIRNQSCRGGGKVSKICRFSRYPCVVSCAGSAFRGSISPYKPLDDLDI